MTPNLLTGLLLPLALGVLMLGMGLGLVPDDFARIVRYPKAAIIGLVNQIVVLPLVGFAIASIVPTSPEIAVGLMIIALCPGGPSSNLLTYLARGDVALSVTLTAFSSAITVFTIPFFTNLSLQHFAGQNNPIELPLVATIAQIFLITLLPVAIGMLIRGRFPFFAKRLEPVTNRLAIGFLVLIILLLVIREWNRLPLFIWQAGIAVVLLNAIAVSIGFFSGCFWKLNFPQRICIAIEVGVQNGTLAIAIAAGLLKNPDLAIPAMVYSLWMYASAFAMVSFGRKSA